MRLVRNFTSSGEITITQLYIVKSHAFLITHENVGLHRMVILENPPKESDLHYLTSINLKLSETLMP